MHTTVVGMRVVANCWKTYTRYAYTTIHCTYSQNITDVDLQTLRHICSRTKEVRERHGPRGSTSTRPPQRWQRQRRPSRQSLSTYNRFFCFSCGVISSARHTHTLTHTHKQTNKNKNTKMHTHMHHHTYTHVRTHTHTPHTNTHKHYTRPVCVTFEPLAPSTRQRTGQIERALDFKQAYRWLQQCDDVSRSFLLQPQTLILSYGTYRNFFVNLTFFFCLFCPNLFLTYDKLCMYRFGHVDLTLTQRHSHSCWAHSWCCLPASHFVLPSPPPLSRPLPNCGVLCPTLVVPLLWVLCHFTGLGCKWERRTMMHSRVRATICVYYAGCRRTGAGCCCVCVCSTTLHMYSTHTHGTTQTH